MQTELKAAGGARVTKLERAFRDFTQTSMALETAYRELEVRVDVLSSALAKAQDERLVQLAEKERLADRLQGLLETLPAGVVVLNADGRVQEFNPGAARLLNDSLSGQFWRDIVESFFDRESECPGEFKLCDGRIVSVSTCELPSGQGRIVLISDITETRRLQVLLSRNQRLSEIGQMNARLAHQLRTPLATAVLYACQLKDGDSPSRVERYSKKILGSLQHLDRMVNDMLRFAGGTSATSHRPIAVNELYAEVAAQMDAQLSDGMVLEFGAPAGLTISGDREALTGALLNLATNAVEHCGSLAQVTLVADTDDDHVLLQVRDNGPGIEASLHEKIFEPFFTTRANGTGLGLAVVASVARGHGGKAYVDSSSDQGAVLTIAIPATNKSALQSGRTLTSASNLVTKLK